MRKLFYCVVMLLSFFISSCSSGKVENKYDNFEKENYKITKLYYNCGLDYILLLEIYGEKYILSQHGGIIKVEGNEE